MLKISNQNDSILLSDNSEKNLVVKTLKEQVDKCENITVDISDMNLMDACRISVLRSTEQYIEDPNVHINWIVSSASVADVASSLSLGNSSFLYD